MKNWGQKMKCECGSEMYIPEGSMTIDTAPPMNYFKCDLCEKGKWVEEENWTA